MVPWSSVSKVKVIVQMYFSCDITHTIDHSEFILTYTPTYQPLGTKCALKEHVLILTNISWYRSSIVKAIH